MRALNTQILSNFIIYAKIEYVNPKTQFFSKILLMIGNIIKELRIEKKLTQQQLAEKIGSTQKQISKWEKNFIEPNIQWIKILCYFFDVSADYLLEIEEGRKKETIINNSFNNNSGSINFKS